jgi:hypothetical protein
VFFVCHLVFLLGRSEPFQNALRVRVALEVEEKGMIFLPNAVILSDAFKG